MTGVQTCALPISWASSHLGSTRELGGERNGDLYILLFDLQKDYISVFMMLNQTYYGVFPISKQSIGLPENIFVKLLAGNSF